MFMAMRHSVAELKSKGAFNRPEVYNRIPLTIRDAMTVTRKMGVCYLWVDSFCITQDADEEKKMKNVNSMDAISPFGSDRWMVGRCMLSGLPFATLRKPVCRILRTSPDVLNERK